VRDVLATVAAVLDFAAAIALAPGRFLLYLATKRRWRARLAEALAADPPLLAPVARPKGAGGRPATIFLSVGDVSAEGHAVRLVRETSARRDGIRWIGFGGEKLREAGCEVRFDLVRLGLIGFQSVLRALPTLLGVVRTFARALRVEQPDVVVLLDYPGLHLVLARLARRAGIPVVYYVPPQVWAWAPWRHRRLRRDAARVLAIVPFEARWFEARGVPVSFVGHPLGDSFADRSESTATEEPRKVALLPGSRRREVRLNLPAQLRIVERLRAHEPRLRGVVGQPGAGAAEILARSRGDEASIAPFEEAIAGARLALAKSGTGLLELARRGVPGVVLYRVPRPFARAGRWLLATRWFAMVNLLANEEVLPEFCFDREEDEERIAQSARSLLEEGPQRERAKAGLARARARFDVPGTAARAAGVLLEILDGKGIPARRPRPRLARAGLFALALAGAVVLAEAAVRALDPFGASYHSETIRYRNECLRLVVRPDHPEDLDGVLIEHRPGVRVPFRNFTVEIDSRGLRGPEIAVPKPPGTWRALFLGDSVTFGWGVDDEETFVRRIEKEWNDRAGATGLRYEALNGGHLLFDTTQEYAFLKRTGWGLEPDAVFLVYVVNDIDSSRAVYEAAMTARGGAPSLLDRTKGTLGRLLPAMTDLARFLSARVPPAASRDPLAGREEGWERSKAALLRIRDACAARGVPFLVLDHTLPPIEALPDFCRWEGIEIAPLRFLPEEFGPEYRLSAADPHANARGHEVLFRRLSSVVPNPNEVYETRRDPVRRRRRSRGPGRRGRRSRPCGGRGPSPRARSDPVRTPRRVLGTPFPCTPGRGGSPPPSPRRAGG
jgi:lipid-A-disaccharide synthase